MDTGQNHVERQPEKQRRRATKHEEGRGYKHSGTLDTQAANDLDENKAGKGLKGYDANARRANIMGTGRNGKRRDTRR